MAVMALNEGIEGNAEVPEEEAAGSVVFDVAVVARHEAASRGALVQLAQCVREIVGEPDSVGALDHADVEVEVAHEALDHVAADLVVLAARETALDGRESRVQRVLVAVQLLRVLRKGPAQVAD